MANWLGGGWSSQLDQLKKQVTDFTKDVLVADEENSEEKGERVHQGFREISHEELLQEEVNRLEQLRLVSFIVIELFSRYTVAASSDGHGMSYLSQV